MKKLFIILALLSTSAFATHTCTTCYVDPVGGDDTNTGASKVLAWKHLPGMPSCTGVCATQVPVAGDSYILKGGTTWTGNANLGIVWNWAGTSASPIHITIDATWFTSATVTGLVNTNGTIVTRVVDSNPISYPFSSAWAGTTITINGSNFTIASVTSQNSLTLSTSAGSLSSVAYSYTGFTRPIWDCNSEEACGSNTIGQNGQPGAGEMDIFYAAKQWIFVDNIEAKNMTYPVDRGNVSVTAWNATSTTAATFTGTNTFAAGQIVGISSNFAGSGTQFNGKPMRVTASNGSTFSVVLVRSVDSYTVSSGSDTATFVTSGYVRNGFESAPGTAATPTNFHGTYLFWHSSVIPTNPKTSVRMNFSKSVNNGAAGASNGTTWQYDTCDETDEIGGHGGDCFVTGDIVDSSDAIRQVGMFNGNFNQITNNNILHMQTTSLDVGDHCDIAQIGQFSGTVNIFANNVIGDNSACNGGTNAGVNQFSGATSINYSYNNVFWGISGGQAIFACGGHTNADYGKCYIYNNSAQSSTNQTFAATASTASATVVTIANNHYITASGTAAMCLKADSQSTCTTVGSGNLQQSTAVATASPNTPSGYTAAGVGGFALAPGAVGWSTVAAGDTKATLDAAGMNTPTPSTDTTYGGLRVTSTRPSAASWGIGAYEFGVSPWTITVSCQGTANGTIKEPANGANINAVCTAGVASGTTFASYVNGTAVTLVGASTSGTFIGWTDALCSSFVTSNCTFNAGSSPTITAAFQLVPTNTLSCSPCIVNYGQSVTLTTTVANMQSPAVIDDGWAITDPNGDQVNNNSGVAMAVGYPTVGNGTFNGASSPALTFIPTISGTYSIQTQSGSLQSTAATVTILVIGNYRNGGVRSFGGTVSY